MVTPGVDVEQCRSGDRARGRAAFGIPGDALVLSMFARVGVMKGQADFVTALGRLSTRFPNLYGVMCGPADKSSAYWGRLQRLVAEHGLEERLVIPGDVRPPLKDDVVAGSDIVVHPSHAESFGLAVLEAMAAGKAVVAADTDGPRLLIEDGVSGVLVAPGDVDALRRGTGRPTRRPLKGAPPWGPERRSSGSDTAWTTWSGNSKRCGTTCSGGALAGGGAARHPVVPVAPRPGWRTERPSTGIRRRHRMYRM